MSMSDNEPRIVTAATAPAPAPAPAKTTAAAATATATNDASIVGTTKPTLDEATVVRTAILSEAAAAATSTSA